MLLLSVTDSPAEAVEIVLKARADKPDAEVTGKAPSGDKKMVES
jgi:hypothetical protein